MKKLLFFIMTVVLVAGCTKMTVDTDKISSRVSIKPAFVLAVSGDVNLGDLIQPGDTILDPRDTILFDETGLMKIFVYEDSLFNLSVGDFYSGFPEESFTGIYQVLSTVPEIIEEAIDFDPGADIELRSMKIATGDITYSITSSCSFPVSFQLTFSGIYDESDNVVQKIISVGANTTVNGSLNLDGGMADFTLDPTQPYNRILVNGLVTPGGSGTEPMGEISIDINVPEPDYDYITGYFGMQTEEQENDTIDLDLGEIFGGNTNAFYLANPILRMHYRNSFGVPMEIAMEARGTSNEGGDISLNRAPEDLIYPTTTETRDVESTFVIDKDNSDLPDLVSMFPDKIIIGGSATANPLGDVGQDNIVFGDSRLLVDLEVEIPMEFWMNNLVLSDTIDSFLLPDDDGESPFDFIDEFELRMYIENGFPLGGTFSISLYDSASANVMSTIETGDFFDPAPVDGNGVVTSLSEKSKTIALTENFKDDSYVADKMIINFTFNTTGSGAPPVKIMSDYSIYFRAGLVVRAGFDENLK